MSVKYTHSNNRHTLLGAQEALPFIFGENPPSSIVDVGCGTGTWLRAASDAGVTKIKGINGRIPPEEELHIDSGRILEADLSLPLNLDEKFDMALCLEVAEHLDQAHAVLAYMWFNLAGASGYKIAKANMEGLSKKMTPEQIAEAQKLSREWKPKNQ